VLGFWEEVKTASVMAAGISMSRKRLPIATTIRQHSPCRRWWLRAFGSALEGWEAMKNQLMRYFTGKTTGRRLQTIMDIVSTWAPAADNNDRSSMPSGCGWMGVSPTARLTCPTPIRWGALMQSMARKEGYSNWNSPLAHQAAGAQVQQQNTYNIYGGNAQGSRPGSRSPPA
jgi:hypothetical protein